MKTVVHTVVLCCYGVMLCHGVLSRHVMVHCCYGVMACCYVIVLLWCYVMVLCYDVIGVVL